MRADVMFSWMGVLIVRLIDADATLERVKPYSKSDEEWACTGGTVKRLIHDAIDKAPTVDAVPVVRCKDCKYGTLAWSGSVLCGHPEYDLLEGALAYGADHFCAYGEREG